MGCSDSNTAEQLYNCNDRGMILGENVGSVYSRGKEIQRVYSRGKLVWEKGEQGYSSIPFTVEAIDDTVSVSLPNTFRYSKNGGSWVDINGGGSIDLVKNDKVRITTTNTFNCKITGLSDIYGNIMSLIYGEKFIGQKVYPSNGYNGVDTGYIGFFSGSDIRNAENLILPATTLSGYCYKGMFSNCTSLTTAPELPATTLSFNCYDSMFLGCSSLKTAPNLPATTLSDRCYMYMFGGCTSLTTAPNLSANILTYGCYMYMFSDCTSLTTAPELPATTLTTECYMSMFSGCSSLKTASNLPATTLSGHCYDSMFYGCTSLTTAPNLPATTLSSYCYHRMFYGCTSLTTAPELKASELIDRCYERMFFNCTSLTYIKCYATSYIEDNVNYWTYGIKTKGTLKCKKYYGGASPLEDYIPSTWSVEYFT